MVDAGVRRLKTRGAQFGETEAWDRNLQGRPLRREKRVSVMLPTELVEKVRDVPRA